LLLQHVLRSDISGNCCYSMFYVLISQEIAATACSTFWYLRRLQLQLVQRSDIPTMRQGCGRYLVAPSWVSSSVLYLNLPVFCWHKAMGKSLLHYLDLHVVQEMTLPVAKLTNRQWYMSDWVRNISAMSLTGKIQVQLDSLRYKYNWTCFRSYVRS